MASTFKNFVKKDVGTSNTTIYQPTTGGIQSTIIGLTLCNTTNTAVEASVLLYQHATTNTVFVLKEAIVPVGSSIVPVGGDQKLVITANDAVILYSNTASSVDAVLSVLEIT